MRQCLSLTQRKPCISFGVCGKDRGLADERQSWGFPAGL